MKAYRFIFMIGAANLIVPFLGIQFVYKHYILVALAVVTLAYAVLFRAIEKEKENTTLQKNQSDAQSTFAEKKQKTIDEVIEMKEETKKRASDVLLKKSGQRPKVLANALRRYDE